MKELESSTAVHPSTTVLDEIGTGLVLVNQDGEVGMTNRIADELLIRRVNKTSLLARSSSGPRAARRSRRKKLGP